MNWKHPPDLSAPALRSSQLQINFPHSEQGSISSDVAGVDWSLDMLLDRRLSLPLAVVTVILVLLTMLLFLEPGIVPGISTASLVPNRPPWNSLEGVISMAERRLTPLAMDAGKLSCVVGDPPLVNDDVLDLLISGMSTSILFREEVGFIWLERESWELIYYIANWSYLPKRGLIYFYFFNSIKIYWKIYVILHSY